jgi:phosphatidylglycerophosphatase A
VGGFELPKAKTDPSEVARRRVDAALRAMQLKHPGGSVRDARATSVVVFVSFVRVMVLWILLFVAEKVYQSTYVERALTVAGAVDRSRLPSLWLLMPAPWWAQLMAFGLFRYFDAAKPGPVGWADRRYKLQPGQAIGWRQGFGILLDDFVAAGCTLLVMALGLTLLSRFWSP